MPNYRNEFHLDVEDIDLIEHALRRAVSEEVKGETAPAYHSTPRERRMNELLGKIHNQKIFYSVASSSSVPLG